MCARRRDGERNILDGNSTGGENFHYPSVPRTDLPSLCSSSWMRGHYVELQRDAPGTSLWFHLSSEIHGGPFSGIVIVRVEPSLSAILSSPTTLIASIACQMQAPCDGACTPSRPLSHRTFLLARRIVQLCRKAKAVPINTSHQNRSVQPPPRDVVSSAISPVSLKHGSPGQKTDRTSPPPIARSPV